MRPEFTVARDKLEDLREQIRETSKKTFRDGARILFESYPELESFSWRQYTIYFNDGDPCYFSAHRDSFFVNDEWNYNMEEDSPLASVTNEVGDLLSVFSNDDFEFMFGDHVQVTVTKDSIFISEYTNHD